MPECAHFKNHFRLTGYKSFGAGETAEWELAQIAENLVEIIRGSGLFLVDENEEGFGKEDLSRDILTACEYDFDAVSSEKEGIICSINDFMEKWRSRIRKTDMEKHLATIWMEDD